MRTYVLDTGPLVELAVAEYQGPGRRSLEGLLKLSEFHRRVLRFTLHGWARSKQFRVVAPEELPPPE